MSSKNDSTSNFKTITSEKSHSNFNFGKTIFVPFLSGIVGAAVIMGVCFGVPEVRKQLIGSTSTSTISTVESSSSSDGTISQVELSNFSDTAIYAANKILPSIVGIEVTYSVSNPLYSIFGNSSSASSTATATGSGIIISEDGYIVTNNHIVDTSSESYYTVSEASSVVVKLYNDDTEYPGTIIGQDEQTDLAVIKIDKTGLDKATFANSDDVKVGEFALAAGNPLGLSSTITVGVISAVNRKVESDGKTFTLIQTDAAINAGNSGGALVNSEGNVIGINTLKLSGTGIEGMGFAIPINSTIDIIDQLIEYNKVKRPYIGITGRDIDESMAKQYNLVVGVYIASVEEYSPAEKAGLKVGDVITKVDGQTVTTMSELTEIRNSKSIGDVITITYNRNGKEETTELTLGEQ